MSLAGIVLVLAGVPRSSAALRAPSAVRELAARRTFVEPNFIDGN